MNRQETIRLLEQHLTELETRFGIRQLSLFGSVSRGEATSVSDVDILVDFGEAPKFRQYMDALLYLEDVLGCQVDLVTKGTLKQEVTPFAEKDLLTISLGA